MTRSLIVLLALAAACRSAEPPARPPAESPGEETPGERTPEGAAAARAERFRALGATFVGSGNEPGWLLAMWPDSVVLIANYGEDTLRFPPAEPGDLPGGGRRWRLDAGGRLLSLTILPEPCTDDMSGAQFPSTVRYILDSLPGHRGCGTPLDD